MVLLKQKKSPIVENELRDVFVSYHFTTHDLKHNGFGNYVGKFNTEIYVGNMAKFIQDLEKSVNLAVEEMLGTKVHVKILYFR